MGKKFEALKKTSDSLFSWVGIIVDIVVWLKGPHSNSAVLKFVGLAVLFIVLSLPFWANVLLSFGLFVFWFACVLLSVLLCHWFYKAADYIERKDDC